MPPRKRTLATIVSNSTYPVTLADGSDLPSGAERSGVDMDAVPNRALYADHHISVIDGFEPRSRVTNAHEEYDDFTAATAAGDNEEKQK